MSYKNSQLLRVDGMKEVISNLPSGDSSSGEGSIELPLSIENGGTNANSSHEAMSNLVDYEWYSDTAGGVDYHNPLSIYGSTSGWLASGLYPKPPSTLTGVRPDTTKSNCLCIVNFGKTHTKAGFNQGINRFSLLNYGNGILYTQSVTDGSYNLDKDKWVRLATIKDIGGRHKLTTQRQQDGILYTCHFNKYDNSFDASSNNKFKFSINNETVSFCLDMWNDDIEQVDTYQSSYLDSWRIRGTILRTNSGQIQTPPADLSPFHNNIYKIGTASALFGDILYTWELLLTVMPNKMILSSIHDGRLWALNNSKKIYFQHPAYKSPVHMHGIFSLNQPLFTL